MRLIFFDTETTGNTERDRLCQLGIKERGIVEPVLNALYQPPVPISIESMVIHHITPKMVAGRPHFTDAAEYGDLKRLFESEDTVSVAHNAAFDSAMLAREGIHPRTIICSYKVASALDPNGLIPKYQLQYLRYLLELEVEADAHDAFGDVLVLEAVFERLLAKMLKQKASEAEALQEMVAISSRPMLFTTLRFGKHKGKRIEDVAKLDKGYLEWLLSEKRKEPAVEADWIFTLEHYLAA